MNYRLAASAEMDVTAAVLWYEDQAIGLGEALLDDIELKLCHICDYPRSYAAVIGEFRKASLDRFSYYIVYRIMSDHIEVAAIFICGAILIHGKEGFHDATYCAA